MVYLIFVSFWGYFIFYVLYVFGRSYKLKNVLWDIMVDFRVMIGRFFFRVFFIFVLIWMFLLLFIWVFNCCKRKDLLGLYDLCKRYDLFLRRWKKLYFIINGFDVEYRVGDICWVMVVVWVWVFLELFFFIICVVGWKFIIGICYNYSMKGKFEEFVCKF